jgi:hypothetical protein
MPNDSHNPTAMVVLTGEKPATKALGENKDGVLRVVRGYSNALRFKYSERTVANIRSLFSALKKLSRNPKAFIVRGAVRDHVDTKGKVYRRKDEQSWGDTAHFEECPRAWVMLDLDKLPLDNIDLINAPDQTVERAIKQYLPDCYQDVSFVWQLSSSAGVGDDPGLISVHIWFMLDRPVGYDELKTFHELKAPAVDRAIFRTIQVHYIAAPIFKGGIQDHLPNRIGLVELGNDVVCFPELPPKVVASAYRTIGNSPTGTVHGFENKLKLMGDVDGLEGFHAPLIAAVSSYVYGKFEVEIDKEWLKARLRQAITKAPKRVGRDVSLYLSDAYLDQNISSAISKFCQVVTTPAYPAPTMMPRQARRQIKRHLKKTADRHLKNLMKWNRQKRRYQRQFDIVYAAQEAAARAKAEKNGIDFDAEAEAAALGRDAQCALEFDDVFDPGAAPKGVLNLAVGVGLGKTEMAFKVIKYIRNKARSLLERGKIAKDTRIALKRLTRAVLAVPTHKLADEAVIRAQKAGLSAGAFRGRSYRNEKTGEYPMCDKPKDVQSCIDVRLPVKSSMCISHNAECEFYQSCGYFLQIRQLRDCDVVVVPHASLFHKKPPINSRGLLIIDEQFAFDGIRPRKTFRLSELRQNNDAVMRKDAGGNMLVDNRLTAVLHKLRDDTAEWLVKEPAGNLSDKNRPMELWPQDIHEAIQLEWKTAVYSPVHPGMSRQNFRKALASASAIKKMRLRVDFWKTLLPLVMSDGKQKSGWLVRDTDDEDRPIVHVGGRARIREGWFDGLAICLDATSASDLVQLYFPKHEIDAPPAIEAVQLHVTVLQTIDKAFSASMCIPQKGLEADELQRRKNRADEVHHFIRLRASQFRGQSAGGLDVLVICQQALELHLHELGLPDNVEIAHFNATRGIDRWGGVRCLILIGRTLPSPPDVETLTENLTGWAVDRMPEGRWYYRKSVGIDIGSGIGLPVKGERHSDPMVEIVRSQICEAELIQCAGRGRGVNRAADTPLHLDVLNKVCLPISVDHPVRWDDHAPGRVEEMVASGLLPEGLSAASLIYQELWPTPKTAERAMARAHNATKLNVLYRKPEKGLNAPNSLLNINSRELGVFNKAQTSKSTLVYMGWMIKTWEIKPLAFGALSKMERGQARIDRPNKRALKFKFLFDPHLIPDPQAWLAERTGMKVEAKRLEPPRKHRSQAA